MSNCRGRRGRRRRRGGRRMLRGGRGGGGTGGVSRCVWWTVCRSRRGASVCTSKRSGAKKRRMPALYLYSVLCTVWCAVMCVVWCGVVCTVRVANASSSMYLSPSSPSSSPSSSGTKRKIVDAVSWQNNAFWSDPAGWSTSVCMTDEQFKKATWGRLETRGWVVRKKN